jgi:Zn finger protein HypA/HybF involved in hydrogenase expression
MHELSIARSMFDLAVSRSPDGGRLREIELLVGPLQSIDPVALKWAWASLTDSTPHAGCNLSLVQQPWQLCCRNCGRKFSAADLSAECPQCGSGGATFPLGGSELLLNSIEIAVS